MKTIENNEKELFFYCEKSIYFLYYLPQELRDREEKMERARRGNNMAEG